MKRHIIELSIGIRNHYSQYGLVRHSVDDSYICYRHGSCPLSHEMSAAFHALQLFLKGIAALADAILANKARAVLVTA